MAIPVTKKIWFRRCAFQALFLSTLLSASPCYPRGFLFLHSSQKNLKAVSIPGTISHYAADIELLLLSGSQIVPPTAKLEASMLYFCFLHSFPH